jgi:hypothetical protein
MQGRTYSTDANAVAHDGAGSARKQQESKAKVLIYLIPNPTPDAPSVQASHRPRHWLI